MWAKQKQTGFTIVELLIVIVVIGILAAITIVAYNGIQQRAKEAERQSDITAVAKALELYYVDNGRYPSYGSQFSVRSWATSNLKLSEGSLLAPDDTPAATATSFDNGGPSTGSNTNRYWYWNYSGSRTAKTACGTNGCQLYELYYYSDAKNAWQVQYSANQ